MPPSIEVLFSTSPSASNVPFTAPTRGARRQGDLHPRLCTRYQQKGCDSRGQPTAMWVYPPSHKWKNFLWAGGFESKVLILRLRFVHLLALNYLPVLSSFGERDRTRLSQRAI